MKTLRDLLRLSAVRQTAWLLALFSIISLLSWGGTYWLVQYEMQRNVDARLTLRMEAAISALAAGDPLTQPGPGQTAELVTTTRTDGFSTRNLGPDKNRETRILLKTGPKGQILLTEDLEAQEELRDILAGGMRLSLMATLAGTLFVGFWLARRGQTRLNTLNQGLARVAGGVLDQPIQLEGKDDIALLAQRINRTTEQLKTAMTQIRVQSSNIAHDLRTPLARLRGRIETSLAEAREKDQTIRPGDLEAALVDIDRITGTFDALLRLSRIESGAGKDAFGPIELRHLVEDVAATFGPVIEEAGQALEVAIEAPETITGDRDLIIQLLANLVQNAIRYGAAQQIISLRLIGKRLVLSDEGPGIPFDEREKSLLPLYQGEQTRQNEGFGLGLSLVKAIADLHGAELSLSDGPNGKGLSVTLLFPGRV